MYSFVTVAHHADAWLLRLQARSMRLYVPQELLGEFLVIENAQDGKSVSWENDLRQELGPHAGRVRFMSSRQFGPIPQASGWWTQQVLKMLAANQVTHQRYVVLDAKNHFVSPLRRQFLETPEGKMQTRRYGYERHPLRDALLRALQYCEVPDPQRHVALFTPTATPYTLDKSDVQETIRFVEQKEGGRFADAFIKRQLTEFFLCAAHLVKRGALEQRYTFGQVPCPVMWDDLVSPDAVLKLVREADERGAPIFAVHRRAIPKLNDTSREVLAQFWRRRGLMRTTDQGVQELREQAAIK